MLLCISCEGLRKLVDVEVYVGVAVLTSWSDGWIGNPFFLTFSLGVWCVEFRPDSPG